MWNSFLHFCFMVYYSPENIINIFSYASWYMFGTTKNTKQKERLNKSVKYSKNKQISDTTAFTIAPLTKD